jgi:hypothetical protein
MAVAKDVIVNGLVVIPKGTLASGEVSKLIKAVPGEKDGFVWVRATNLILGNGEHPKLKEYRSGEGACGDMGPCWALLIVAAPFIPLALVERAVRASERPNKRQQGEDETIGVCHGVEGYTANRIVLGMMASRVAEAANLSARVDAPCAPTRAPAKSETNAP